MIKVNIDVRPRGIESAYVNTPFDEGKEELTKCGYRIISLEENARLRKQEGKGTNISTNGNWTREGVLYLNKKGIFLTKNSPIMANAKEATACHRKGQEFYLTDEQVEEGLADSVKLEPKEIPTNRFKDNEITVYAFGEDAEKYGQFLREEAGIKEMPVWLANIQEKPFARQMWFGGLDYRPVLDGYSWYLDCDSWVRGVRDSVSAEGTQKISPEAYTPDQISSVLNKERITGELEKRILKQLKE